MYLIAVFDFSFYSEQGHFFSFACHVRRNNTMKRFKHFNSISIINNNEIMEIHYTFMARPFRLCSIGQIIWSKYVLFMDKNVDFFLLNKRKLQQRMKRNASNLMHWIHIWESFSIALTSIVVIIQEKDPMNFSITYWMAHFKMRVRASKHETKKEIHLNWDWKHDTMKGITCLNGELEYFIAFHLYLCGNRAINYSKLNGNQQCMLDDSNLFCDTRAKHVYVRL